MNALWTQRAVGGGRWVGGETYERLVELVGGGQWVGETYERPWLQLHQVALFVCSANGHLPLCAAHHCIGNHDNDLDIMLPDHLPEVRGRVRQWALADYVLLGRAACSELREQHTTLYVCTHPILYAHTQYCRHTPNTVGTRMHTRTHAHTNTLTANTQICRHIQNPVKCQLQWLNPYIDIAGIDVVCAG